MGPRENLWVEFQSLQRGELVKSGVFAGGGRDVALHRYSCLHGFVTSIFLGIALPRGIVPSNPASFNAYKSNDSRGNLESRSKQAMDELADKLGIDPIELRLRNELAQDPERGVPYSTRQLVGCLKEGARRFGWNQRKMKPGQVAEGRWLLGMGLAAAIRSNLLQASKCRIMLDAQGVLTVRMAMIDIGTGSYTVLTQIAAEMPGLPMAELQADGEIFSLNRTTTRLKCAQICPRFPTRLATIP